MHKKFLQPLCHRVIFSQPTPALLPCDLECIDLTIPPHTYLFPSVDVNMATTTTNLSRSQSERSFQSRAYCSQWGILDLGEGRKAGGNVEGDGYDTALGKNAKDKVGKGRYILRLQFLTCPSCRRHLLAAVFIPKDDSTMSYVAADVSPLQVSFSC